MPPAYVKPYVKRGKNDAAAIVALALANKAAPVAWAVLARGETYRSTPEV